MGCLPGFAQYNPNRVAVQLLDVLHGNDDFVSFANVIDALKAGEGLRTRLKDLLGTASDCNDINEKERNAPLQRIVST